MKLLMKAVEMIARFSLDCTPQPVKYKVIFRQEPIVVRVDQILFKTTEDLISNRAIIFRCQSEINGVLKMYEIKYELGTCRWLLWKM